MAKIITQIFKQEQGNHLFIGFMKDFLTTEPYIPYSRVRNKRTDTFINF